VKLWKRFLDWLHYLRHPSTVITMDEAPAKGVDIHFTYEGSQETWRVYDRPLTEQEIQQHAQVLHVDGEAVAGKISDNLLPDMQQRAKEREQERVRALGDVLDWPIGDYFEFGKPDTSMMYRFLEEEEDDTKH